MNIVFFTSYNETQVSLVKEVLDFNGTWLKKDVLFHVLVCDLFYIQEECDEPEIGDVAVGLLTESLSSLKVRSWSASPDLATSFW